MTEVRISFFKPTGFEDTHYVDTDDRGAAVMEVMAKYTPEQRTCLNYVMACLASRPLVPGAVI